VQGLRARGGWEVDLAWQEGRLQRATLRATAAGSCAVRYGESARTMTFAAGEQRRLDAALLPGGN
jgi:alpha-L-fucosidase 2